MEMLGKGNGDRYDLILMDWRLPGLDGLEASEKILNDPFLPDIPIIMMSAYGREQEVVRAEKIGIKVFLFKPIKQSALFDAIMEIMGFSQSVTAKSESGPGKWRFKGLSVLLAEDNEANQVVAVEVLTQAGFVVDVASNGREALEAVQKQPYNAVLMDLQMPEMDGLEATRKIRALEHGDGLPIIAMTANAMKGDREKCLEAGMDDYVSKPINRMELLRTLAKWTPVQQPVEPSSIETPSTGPVSDRPPDITGVNGSEAMGASGAFLAQI